VKSCLDNTKQKAKALKKELGVIYLAYQRKDMPWYIKLVAIIVIGYALSPIDLIPDFVPILGYLDDIVLVPLGIALVIKLIPSDILKECRTHADEVFKEGKPRNWIAGSLIIGLWVVALGYIVYKIFWC
jgi:uncharacterized membrane protein YkvA (DUF1232 family)